MSLFHQIPLLLRHRRSPEKVNQQRDELASEAKAAEDETDTKEVLGYYLTSHPLAEHQAMLNAYCTHTSTQCATLKHRTEVMLGGMMAALKFSNTKNPKPGETNTRYVMFDLEDTDGIMQCILWPRDFVVDGHLAVPDAIVAVRGSIAAKEAKRST